MGGRATEDLCKEKAQTFTRCVAGGDYGHPKHQRTLPFLRDLSSTSSPDLYNQCPSHTVLGRDEKIE